jgi:phosphatidylglycerol:prolipoprotein diacylglycerol transferase
MHPVLIDIFGIKIYTYGVFVAVALFVSISFVKYQLSRVIGEKKIEKLIFRSLLFGFIGAKLLNVIEHWKIYLSEFHLSPSFIISFFSSGFSFWGVILGIGTYLFIFCRKEDVNCKAIADTISMAILLGLSIGKLGCLSAGCCYGKVCYHKFAIVFKDPLSAAPINVPLWPTQIIESIGYFFLFVLSLFLKKKTNIHTFGFSLSSYCLFRFLVEFIRATTPVILTFRNIQITWVQVVCLVLFFIGIYVLVIDLKRKDNSSKIHTIG